MLTAERRTADAELWAKATPGPWEENGCGPDAPPMAVWTGDEKVAVAFADKKGLGRWTAPESSANMKLVARARTALPEYEQHIQELERRLAEQDGIKARAEALEEMVEVTYTMLGYFDQDDKIARDLARTISEQAQARAENAKEAQCQEDRNAAAI